MDLPAHKYLDTRKIPYERKSFPPENLIRASNAIVVNLTDREKPVGDA